MPVGPSQGASGHDASTFIVLTSSTCMVLVPSLLMKILPLPSLAAPSGELSSSCAVPTMSPVLASSATAVPIGRLSFVRMIRSEKSSYMMPSRPPVETGIFLITARVLRSNIVTVESPPLVMRSEEHTSELQSQSNLVCSLLIEKKNYIPMPRSTHTSST